MLTTPGRFRGGVLVLGVALYATGYLVWSFYAWRNGMGNLPAVDHQYFPAGALLLALLAAVLVAIARGRRFLRAVHTYLRPGCKGLAKVLR